MFLYCEAPCGHDDRGGGGDYSHIKVTGVLVIPFAAFIRVEIWWRFITVLSKTFKRGKSAIEPS